MRIVTAVAVVVLAAALLNLPVSAGTQDVRARLVRDIRIDGSAAPRFLTRAADLVYFRANDGIHGAELWSTDGTRQGTRLVRDIRPGASGSGPTLLTRVGSRVFFTAADGRHGRELWVSDGTTSGTRMVKDLTRGPAGSRIGGIANGGGTAYVSLDYRQLWRTNGTPKGTDLVREFLGVDVAGARWMEGRLYFSANDSLWRTDGTGVGTKRLSPVFWGLDGITPFKGRVYFRAAPPLGAFGGLPELWWSDGTRSSTKRLGTMLNPSQLTPFAGRLWFNAHRSVATSPRLYRGDGTVAGTGPVVPWVRPLHDMAPAAGRLWSAPAAPGDGKPHELWVSDGTAAGTLRLRGGGDWIVQGWDGQKLAALRGRMWFSATPVELVGGQARATDSEVWSSDGTPAGTMEAVGINPAGSSAPRDLVRLGSVLLLSANDGVHGRELWSIASP